jgi:peptidoglycan/LPS O-acetylase OafA/YrhL
MITAFLFVSKILNTNNNKIDWNALYVSRIFRLVPMYLVSIFVLVLIVFIVGHWTINEPLGALAKEIFYWTTFGIIQHPAINDFSETNMINAGIVWSLAYEWLFYLSLPVISIVLLAKKTSLVYTVMSLAFIIGFCSFRSVNPHHILSFAGGAVAPFLVRSKRNNINFNSYIFSVIVVLALTSLLFFNTAESIVCKLIVILVFNLIALGNSVFGILKSTTLKFLGEICYSTYLVHGIILFVVMYFVIHLEEAKELSVCLNSGPLYLLLHHLLLL